MKVKITVTARAGGHSYAAYGLGGEDGHLVVDLRNFNNISVDVVTGIATIGAGCRLGDIAIALFNQAGRALPHGTCPLVGIGGHASYGGYVLPLRARQLTPQCHLVDMDSRVDNGVSHWTP